jgi:hypothetical protein
VPAHRVRAQGEVTARSTEAAARGKVPGWWHFGSRGKSMAWAVEALELGNVSCDVVAAEVGHEADLAAMRWLQALGRIRGGERSEVGARRIEGTRFIRKNVCCRRWMILQRMMIFRATWPYSQRFTYPSPFRTSLLTRVSIV